MILNGENQIEDFQTYSDGTGLYDQTLLDTTSTSYVSSGASVTFANCNVGERGIFAFNYTATADSSSAGDYIVRITDGASTFDLTATERQTDTVGGERLIGLTISYLFSTVGAGGNVTATLMAKRILGSGHVYVKTPVSITALRIRK